MEAGPSSIGQTVIVDNRPGGAGTVGAGAVARAPGDGYTLLFSASAFTTAPMTQKTPAYDVVMDFAPVALVAKAPLAIAVNKNLPFNDVKGLLAYGKANPGKLTFAIGSAGSAGHLSTELLRRVGSLEYVIVPYKGSAPAYQDLIGGSIDAFIDPILGSASFSKAGQLKVLAVTSSVWGPASLPKDIATRLNAEVNKALATDMREKLTQQWLLLTPGSIDDFAHFQKEDMALSLRIITDGKIRAE
jgi:tripartite-type tricarboxylate transporter receptor subunit TctC